MIGQPLQSIFTQTGGSEPKAAEPNHCSDALDGPGNFEPFFSFHTTQLRSQPARSTQTQTRLSTHTLPTLLLPLYANRNHGAWEVGYVMPLSVRARHGRTHFEHSTETNHATDDEEEDSSSPSSPVTKPIARRSKFDDEEEDSDVRQPTIPRLHNSLPLHAQNHITPYILTLYSAGPRVVGRRRRLGSRARKSQKGRRIQSQSRSRSQGQQKVQSPAHRRAPRSQPPAPRSRPRRKRRRRNRRGTPHPPAPTRTRRLARPGRRTLWRPRRQQSTRRQAHYRRRRERSGKSSRSVRPRHLQSKYKGPVCQAPRDAHAAHCRQFKERTVQFVLAGVCQAD
jgi:hypothetical protein